MSILKIIAGLTTALCLAVTTTTFKSERSILPSERPIIVAILDSGADDKHPDLADRFLNGSNETAGWNVLADNRNFKDDNGHGTHLAGIVSQLCKTAKIVPIKVLDENGTGTVNNLVKGISKAIDYDADVVLVSLGTDYYREDLAEMVRKVWNNGGLLIAAAGNSGNEQVLYPAGNLYALGVASTVVAESDLSQWKQRSSFEVSERSNSGIHISVAAPGDAILSALPTYEVKLNKRGFKQVQDVLKGTSQAAAVVAGIAASYWSNDPSATNEDIYRLIEGNATSSNHIWNKNKGYGEVSPNVGTAITEPSRGGIYGQVLYEDNTPAESVSVSLQDGHTATTDNAGMFRFSHLPVKEYELTIEGTGIKERIPIPVHSDYLITLKIRKGETND